MDLAALYWEGALRSSPRWATQRGDHRFDDRLEDLSEAAKRAERSRLEALLAAAEKASPSLTLAVLRHQVTSELLVLACDLEEWSLDPFEGPAVALPEMAAFQPSETAEERRALVARWRAIGPLLDAHVANLRRGLARGRVAARRIATTVLEQLDALLATPVAEWSLALDRSSDVIEALEPARAGFERLRAFVREEVLPRARDDARCGLVHLAGDIYRRLVAVHTTLDLEPGEIHRRGLAEVARSRAALEELGGRVLGARDLGSLRARTASDRSLFFTTRDELLAHATETVRRAEAALPAFFAKRPRSPCVVRAVPDFEERFAPMAYYEPPTETQPGTYRVNVSRPETRPRYAAQALAFHEAIPGHHVQLALAQELSDLPELRRHADSTAYVEGWALYAERLADEMGLYASDLDRLGMLALDAWRSCRLVVDTGLHELGWPRARALAFLEENTLLAGDDASAEVDRCIACPGQALAYKLGSLELGALRDEARARLGERFELRAFHDRVLEEGALPLPLLRERIEAWSETSGAPRPRTDA